jgi:NitT/TauT family transport system substrate-binding protein
MKKLLIGALALAAGLMTSASAFAADPVTIQLKWVTQAQFAGYLVAKAKGFYDAEGLDVTIKPGGPDVSPVQVIAGGGADVIVDWMADALASREKGVKLVNIAQPFKSSGLLFVCRKDTGIASPADFKGKTLGVWFYGNEYPFMAWMAKLGYKTDGSAGGVTVLKQAFNVDPLVQKQADCISAMIYNEYGQILDAGLKPEDLTVFNYRDEKVGMLEDGLYVLEDKLADPAFVDKMARFVKASEKGWDYARANPDEAAQITVDADESGSQLLDHQKYMIGEVNKLTAGTTGALDAADYKQTVDTLLSAGGVISKEPDAAAVSSVVTDKAGLKYALGIGLRTRKRAPRGARFRSGAKAPASPLSRESGGELERGLHRAQTPSDTACKPPPDLPRKRERSRRSYTIFFSISGRFSRIRS